MADLSEFLLARIAEDEEVAREAAQWTNGQAEWGDGDLDAGDPDERHIARWDPARVLAECEAKRQVVSVLWTELGLIGQPPFAPGNGRASRYAVAQTTLRLLALPYADHPDYQQEWRP